MCTAAERIALHAVACPWCGAAPREECTVREADVRHTKGTRRYQPRRVTTLDGGCHEARWQTALGRPARVVNVESIRPTPESGSEGRVVAARGSVAVMDRPW